MSERSRSFGRIAERYDDYRPSPPAGLAAYLGDVAGVPTLEVGAGTGKVTRFLLGLGARVVAVEPDPGMRAVLVARTPGVDVVDGVAESLPLADASVDLAVVSSAWHWFAQPAATDEFARVLSDGGRIFVLGNGFAERHQWFEDIAQTPDPTAVTAGARHSRESGEDLGRRFVDVESFSIEWAWWRTHDELMGMFSTYSGYITATPDEREALDRIAVEGLARVLPTGEGDVAMNLHGVHAVRPPRGRGA